MIQVFHCTKAREYNIPLEGGNSSLTLPAYRREYLYTLNKISNWSPYIFMLVLKVKFDYTKFMLI